MALQPTLDTARLVLRPFLPTDAAVVQRLAGAQEIAATTLSMPHPYEDGMAEAWISGHGPGWDRGEQAIFAITEPAAGLIGAVGLRIEGIHRRAELGYWIGVPFWGQGYATETVRAVLDFGFRELDLHRIYASHLTRNPASGRVMEKAGMRWEGCQRHHVLKWGQFEDLAIWGVVNEQPRVRAE